ncbi:hypothetical protein [Streptomyces silvisoli]|uniref:Uncharacterized protein n=1 Tax=Streptomyces silvisoli TaxID=3034235 RepID=A0ABT5ZSA2_9ACTN|nr:hypothetical protein [Streptomyces silvisoli]MDF3292404.1 hypothetical protein [Streptomyces silvisoli]
MAGYLVNITSDVWDAAAYQDAVAKVRRQPAVAAPSATSTSTQQATASANGRRAAPRRR